MDTPPFDFAKSPRFAKYLNRPLTPAEFNEVCGVVEKISVRAAMHALLNSFCRAFPWLTGEEIPVPDSREEALASVAAIYEAVRELAKRPPLQGEKPGAAN